MEETLALLSQRYVTLFAEHYTAVINRSYEEIWEPRLTGDAHGLYNELIAQMERARSISAEIDSTMAAVADDPDLRAAELERDALAAELETAVRSEQDMRRRIAHEVAARGRVQLDGEREALDYHLCDASYELAVELATHPETAEDTTVVAPPRRRAITHLDAFLQRYPQSVARSETRYRLADLMLMQARDDFQIQMARFLDADPTADDLGNRALAPFVEYAPAIALYESIIADDPEFPHMDAVLFNLGMILSDDGRPEAREYLEQLVQRYPDSPDCQEAWLRLGGDRFDREDYAGCINYLETAATGDDATFTAIALYKLGWAHFEQDHFGQSTDTFRKLMDHYADHPDLAADMDLRDEAEEYLVHSLGRSGGAQAYADYFGMIGPRPYEQDILLSLGHLMRNVSLYKEAAECDLLWLEKYPEHEKTLAVVERLVDTYKNGNEADLARETKLRAAPRFLPGGEWYEANSDSELRADGIAFAQSAFRENAAYFHRLAREGDDPAAWRSALGSYELYLTHWPDIDDAHQVHYLAGEAAVRIGDYGASLGHFEAAALSDSLELARDAAWQRVAVADTWYRNTQPSQTENGTDSLAALLLNAGHDFIDRFGTDERATDIIWRQANIAYAHEWNTAAAASFALFAQRYPNDPRASVAIRMSGDAHYRHGEYAAAGNAYTHALDMARTAGSDSLAAELEKTIPLCYYKHAEQIVAADSTSGEREAAPLFDRVAREWPRFQYADIALYRAGLGYAADERYGEAIAAWERILEGYPQSEYARDSAIQIALTYDRSGNKTGAAMAYERFSEKYRDDDDAPEALLKAIDLLVEAGDESGAENMRSTFLTRFPGETHAVMEIRASRAAAALASVTAGTTTISALLAPGSDASASNLTAYLTLAEQHPDLATPSILAQVDFLKGEKTYVEYESLRLTQPLPDAIEVKKKKLEELLALYQKSAERGVTEYARASAYRIGAALVEFGDALMESERPDGLSGDDLYAYDDVIAEQSWEFYDRGTDVWSDMLKQTGKTGEDPGGWLVVTREALWPRLAQRFLYKPEIEYPLVLADPPQRTASK
jgi:TolA-binding protein